MNNEYYVDFPYEDDGNAYSENVYDPGSSGVVDGTVYEGTDVPESEKAQPVSSEASNTNETGSTTSNATNESTAEGKPQEQKPKPKPKPKIITAQKRIIRAPVKRTVVKKQQPFTIDWQSFIIGFGAGLVAVWAYNKFFGKKG